MTVYFKEIVPKNHQILVQTGVHLDKSCLDFQQVTAKHKPNERDDDSYQTGRNYPMLKEKKLEDEQFSIELLKKQYIEIVLSLVTAKNRRDSNFSSSILVGEYPNITYLQSQLKEELKKLDPH